MRPNNLEQCIFRVVSESQTVEELFLLSVPEGTEQDALWIEDLSLPEEGLPQLIFHKTGQQANNGVTLTARILHDDCTGKASGQQATAVRQAAHK